MYNGASKVPVAVDFLSVTNHFLSVRNGCRSVTLLLLSGLSNSSHLCGRINQLANLPLCLLHSILFLKERFKPDFVFDEILDVMEGAEAAKQPT